MSRDDVIRCGTAPSASSGPPRLVESSVLEMSRDAQYLCAYNDDGVSSRPMFRAPLLLGNIALWRELEQVDSFVKANDSSWSIFGSCESRVEGHFRHVTTALVDGGHSLDCAIHFGTCFRLLLSLPFPGTSTSINIPPYVLPLIPYCRNNGQRTITHAHERRIGSVCG